MDRLFDVPALEQATADGARFQALGTAAELILTGCLLELGHRVAVPVTDDDGVDLIVNYSLKVQVKSSASRSAQGLLMVSLNNRRASERRGDRGYIRDHVDIVAVYARDARCWWFVPRDEIEARNTRTLGLAEHGRKAAWHEAWHVFGAPTGGTAS